jgi:uncharacterized protein YidB (DUF937 family)
MVAFKLSQGHDMADDFLGQILGSVLGGMTGRGSAAPDYGDDRSPLAGKGGALLAMLLPLAMQWVQRNGGVGALLEKFRQGGYSRQAASWVSTGDNEPISTQAVGEVVGMDELSRLSQQLGVPQEQVADGLAQILPQVVDHLTPTGGVPDDADDMLNSGLAAIEQMFGRR